MRSASALLLAFISMAFAAPATAQYYARINLTFEAPFTCTSTGIASVASGTISSYLPSAPNNVINTWVMNGGAPLVVMQTDPGPFPDVETLTSTGITVVANPPTTPPYTMVVTTFPALNGQPTGLGAQISGVCNADGSASLAIVSDIPAPSFAVPTLQTSLLMAMAALLALMAGVSLARRRRAPRH